MRRTLTYAIVAIAGAAGCGHIMFDPVDGDDPAPARTWSSVSIGDFNGCGLTGGELWCWGQGTGGVLGTGYTPAVAPPARVGEHADWTEVTVSGSHACGLRAGGELYCWGSNTRGALGTGAVAGIAVNPIHVVGARWSAVRAGQEMTCGLQEGGSLWCWGAGDAGQLGRGTFADAAVPDRVGGATWKAIAVGAANACAIQADDSLWCWGRNDRGSVGDGTRGENRPSPVAIAPGRAWRAVETSDFHSCGIDASGNGWCWGQNDDGRLGTGNQEQVHEPRPIAGPPLDALSLGRRHSCATSGERLWCWGASVRGAIAGVTAHSVTAPSRGEQPARAVEAGGDTTCVIDLEGHLACTGANGYGQAGRPAGAVTGLEQADARTDWQRIAAGHSHACGQTADGVVRCWGAGMDGQLGDNASLDRQLPVEAGAGFTNLDLHAGSTAGVRGTELWGWGIDVVTYDRFPAPARFAMDITDVALGRYHGCSLDGTGRLVCGGANVYGQLGDGTGVDNPAAVVPGTWRSVYAANIATCATRTAGGIADRLFCWGAGDMVGIPTQVNLASPAVVTTLEARETRHVALGGSFGCALVDPGEIWCWGGNDHGQLGATGLGGSPVPLRVGARADWIAVEAGGTHACAIAADRTLWCWGRADRGQIGEPVMPRRLPTQIGGDADWEGVALGDQFTCALRRDGTRWCFGDNEAGALGNGRAWGTELAIVP